MSRKLIGIAIAQAIGLSILSYLLPTWQDEEFTLATTLHGIAYALHRSVFYEHQAPVYFLLVAALRPVSASVFFAREISVALVVATTVVSAWLARSVWPGRDPAVFCALLAANPFMVFAALEIRLYALALLLQAVLYVCFFHGFYDGSSRGARIGFAVCATIAIYTQYFSALNVAGCCLALLVAGRYRTFVSCVVASLVPLVAILPMLPIIKVQSAGAMSTQMAPTAGFGGRYVRPVDFLFASAYGSLSHVAALLTKAAKAVAIVAAVVAWPTLDRRFLALFSMFLLTHLAYATVELVTHRTLAAPRHFVALFFPEVIALLALLAGTSGRRAARAIAFIAIAFACSDVAVIASTYGSLSKSGDARRVGAYLGAHAVGGDVIAVFPGDAAPAVARYYPGTAAVTGYPISLQPETYSVDQSIVGSEEEAVRRFAALPPSKHLWFVTIGGCSPGTDVNGCVVVDDAIAKRYTLLSKVTFHGTSVLELAPRRTP